MTTPARRAYPTTLCMLPHPFTDSPMPLPELLSRPLFYSSCIISWPNGLAFFLFSFLSMLNVLCFYRPVLDRNFILSIGFNIIFELGLVTGSK